MTEITWISKNYKAPVDIIITCSATADKFTQTNGYAQVSFSKEVLEKISDTGYVIYGFADEGHKLVFKEADKATGYKLAKDGERMKFMINNKRAIALKTFVGKYDHKMDLTVGLVYVDDRRKKV